GVLVEVDGLDPEVAAEHRHELALGDPPRGHEDPPEALTGAPLLLQGLVELGLVDQVILEQQVTQAGTGPGGGRVHL
ncbi:MAG TPA: hypothetical protein VHM89_16010, partial [Acidimicrobiales bacterium]|nr:hypothetical protein [Acidimicrobiales bacterium]